MENRQIELKEDLNTKSDDKLIDLPFVYEYPLPGNRMDKGGSSQVLGDFFEFSDYLIPNSRNISMYRYSRQSPEDDHYSGLHSI